MTAWSFSRLKTFEQCPKKFNHLYVAKDVKDKETDAILYGNEVHKAAEEYMRDGVPVPKKFSYIEETLNKLKTFSGTKHCELKLAVTESYTPTGFFDSDVWYRGIVDLLIVDGNKAHMIDYKTGKNAKYADTTQLDAMAAAVFTHFPDVETIKSALLFVVSKDFIKKVHKRELVKSYWDIFRPKLDRLEAATETGVWNAVSGPLCRYCPVTKCEHHRG